MNTLDKYTKNNFKEDSETINDVFHAYDSDKDGYINTTEFSSLLHDAFKCSRGNNSITTSLVEMLLPIFDEDQDGKISENEFTNLWKYWLKAILNPVTAIIVVDVQNDFISGSLALKNCPSCQDGEAVVSPINDMLTNVAFDVLIYSIDWHPPNHISFHDNRLLRPFKRETEEESHDDVKELDTVIFAGPPETKQVLWPRHCVQNSDGAKLHPQLKIEEKGYHVYKGTNPDIDSYSAFWDNNKLSKTELVDILMKHHVTDVYVCGLAYDVCVGFTATHATEHGFRTTLIDDASRGVTLQGITDMKTSLLKKGVVITDSNQVQNMVLGNKRLLQHGLKSACNFKLARKIFHSKSS